MNTRDDDRFPPRGDTISDYELSVESSVGSTPSEPEGNYDFYPLTYPATNIVPEGVITHNNYPIGYTTQEGADTPRQRQPHQRKQWPEVVWECGSDNKIK